MAIPLLDLAAQNLPLEEEFVAKFREIIHSSRFILGPEVEKLESSCAELSGAKFGIGVSSGTDALLLALMALDIGPGDEVLCPTFTFFATAGCISRTGATPIFVDACPVCFNIDVADARKKITSKTKAIIPVHLFGQSADMDLVMDLANEHGLKVIEDGAQAIGSTYKGKPVGGIGDFGTFSFFPSKNLGGFGDGGMLVTNDEELYNLAKILRGHGSKPKYFHKFVGGNFRLDPIQAAMLSIKLPHYERFTENRRSNAAYYLEEFLKHDGFVQAKESDCCCPETKAQPAEPKITLPVVYEHNGHIWNQFTLRVHGEGRRDALKAHLVEQKIGCEIYYPVPMHQQECFQDLPPQACPIAEKLATECISIPIYPELNTEQKYLVINSIKDWLALG